MSPPGFVWTVPATIIRWKDGDTCEAKLDLGWRISLERTAVRLLHLYCDEIHDKDPDKIASALAALARAMELAPAGTPVILHSYRLGTAGEWGSAQETLSRTLADIELPDGRNYASVMVAEGHGDATPGRGD